MTMKDLREFLKWLHIETKSNPGGVVLIERVDASIDTSDGKLGRLVMSGDYGSWTKTFDPVDNTTLDRCYEFALRKEVGVDTTPVNATQGAMDALQRLLFGEYGRQCLKYGEEFGAEELVFKVPTRLLMAATQQHDKDVTNGIASDTTAQG